MNYADMVVETISTAPGTGAVTLTGTAATGYSTFASAVADGTQVSYRITDAAGNWEVGDGVLSSGGTNLTRDFVWSNSAGTQTQLNFSTSVTRTVSLVDPAVKIADIGLVYAMQMGIYGMGV